MGTLVLTYRKISELKSYPRNARTHTRKQVKQIKASIEEFGFTNPILLDENHQIIAGHGRVQAAKLLGLAEVPTVQVAHLTATQKRAYILADNRAADTKSDRHGDDNIPSAGPAVTQAGDLWQLGAHRIFCGNALESVSYGNLLDGRKASLIFTDPPYNVTIGGNVGGKGEIHHREFAMGSGEMTAPIFTSFLTTTFQHLAANSLDGSIHYTCMDWRHMQEMLAAGYNVYTELKNVCVWNKSNGGMGTFYRSKHELVFVWKSGTAPHLNNFELGQHGRNRTNVWDYAGVNTFRSGRMDELQMHPTVKPVALVVDAIKDCSKQGDIVLDPFCGSGTIIVAAERTGRKARALEIDAAYVDVAIRRWEQLTGKSATLSTGETFEEITEQRTVELDLAQVEAVALLAGGNHVGVL